MVETNVVKLNEGAVVGRGRGKELYNDALSRADSQMNYKQLGKNRTKDKMAWFIYIYTYSTCMCTYKHIYVCK